MALSSAARNASIELNLVAQGRKFGTILADPPWQFQNRTGKIAPEHYRSNRYPTLALGDIWRSTD